MQKSLENACKHVKRWKMKVKMVLPSIDEENLWSFDHENDKKKKKKKKKKKMRDQERNRSDRQKDILKKSDLIPICFKNSKSN